MATLLATPARGAADADEAALLDYFLTHRTRAGTVLDGTHCADTVSVAATGFGMACWAVAADAGRLPHAKAISWVRQALDATLVANAGNRGWLCHFADAAGRPKFTEEISSIDTAIFYLGARDAARRLGDPILAAEVERHIGAVDLEWMLTNGGDAARRGKRHFSHGFYWRNGRDGRRAEFLGCDWEAYSEGVLLYRLFGLPYRREPDPADYDLPLFAFYYPLCFFDDAAYVARLRKCVARQLDRGDGLFGWTACPGPEGYGVMEPHVISPVAIWACTPWIPEAAELLDRLGVPKAAPWYDLRTGRHGAGGVAIDLGSCLLLLDKARAGGEIPQRLAA